MADSTLLGRALAHSNSGRLKSATIISRDRTNAADQSFSVLFWRSRHSATNLLGVLLFRASKEHRLRYGRAYLIRALGFVDQKGRFGPLARQQPFGKGRDENHRHIADAFQNVIDAPMSEDLSANETR